MIRVLRNTSPLISLSQHAISAYIAADLRSDVPRSNADRLRMYQLRLSAHQALQRQQQAAPFDCDFEHHRKLQRGALCRSQMQQHWAKRAQQ